MLKILKNEKGWALTLVLIILVVVPVLAASLYMYSSSAIDIVAFHRDREIARYMALSGLEAAKMVWLEADVEDKPVGTLETTYFLQDQTFKVVGETTQEERDNAKGYIDVTLERITDTESLYYNSTVITSIATTPNTSYKTVATSIPMVSGVEAGWHDAGQRVLKPGDKLVEITLDRTPNDFNIMFFDLRGIVSAYSGNQKQGFTFPTDGKIGLAADSIFFKSDISLHAGGTTNILVLSSSVTVLEGRLDLMKTNNNYSTMVIKVPELLAINVPDKEGLYGMVHFGDDVIMRTRERPGGPPGSNVKIINAGTSFYVRSDPNGVDLIKWFDDDKNADDMFLIPAGDPNRMVPTEESSAYFIYN